MCIIKGVSLAVTFWIKVKYALPLHHPHLVSEYGCQGDQENLFHWLPSWPFQYIIDEAY